MPLSALGLTLWVGARLSGRQATLWPAAFLAAGVALTGGMLVHDFQPGGWVVAGLVSVLIITVTLALMWRFPDAQAASSTRASPRAARRRLRDGGQAAQRPRCGTAGRGGGPRRGHRQRHIPGGMIVVSGMTTTTAVTNRTTGQLRFLGRLIKAGGAVDALNAAGIEGVQHADTADLLAGLARAYRLPFFRLNPQLALFETVVHQQDIRRSLGATRDIPAETLRVVLDVGLKTNASLANGLLPG
jgi:hypothetical protein